MTLSGTGSSPSLSLQKYTPTPHEIHRRISGFIEQQGPFPTGSSPSEVQPREPRELQKLISRFIEDQGPYGTQGS
jgi:hypothetical protein